MASSKGVIDSRLTPLLFEFIETINRLQFEQVTSNGFDKISLKELQVIDGVGRGKMSMGHLAKKLGIKESTLTHITDKLVRKKYVLRYHSEQDRRQVLIKLTDKGSEVMRKNLEQKHKIIDSIIGTLEFEQQVSFLNILEQVSKNTSF